jgi:hypothetical protein
MPSAAQPSSLDRRTFVPAVDPREDGTLVDEMVADTELGRCMTAAYERVVKVKRVKRAIGRSEFSLNILG